MLKLAAPLLIALTIAAPALAGERFGGRVTHIADGDTFTLDTGVKVRLWGIDTPEKKQSCDGADGKPYPCGVRARLALEAVALGRDVECEDKQKGGSYDRRVAACSVGGQDLGAFMASAGYAVDYKRYSKGRYLPEQRQAEAEKRGIWSGRFQLPAEWRKERRG